MKLKIIVMCIFLSVAPLFSQDQNAAREDFWVSLVGEANFFSVSNTAFGGGIALGYGDGVSFGFRAVYFFGIDLVKTLEFNFLLRFYLPRLTGHSGLFIQFNGGPVLFEPISSYTAIPSKLGTFSAGISVGWRFIFGNYFYLEPAVRVGYPYVVGIGASAGLRF
jgi:hypothetical protein